MLVYSLFDVSLTPMFGLIAVATIIVIWPDHELCRKLKMGSPQVRWMRRTGVLRPRENKEPLLTSDRQGST